MNSKQVMFTIRLRLHTQIGIYRYAANPSETFDASHTCCVRNDAKKFKSIPAAMRWLVRHGIAERGTGLLAGHPLFDGWSIARIDKSHID